MKSILARLVFLTVVLLLSGLEKSVAAPDYPLPVPDSTAYTIIFYIGHLNSDCLRDTVVGVSYFSEFALPQYVLWGKADSTNPGCADTAVGGPFFDSLKVDTTLIQYPDWTGLSGTVAFLELNSDTLTDMMVVVWGRADTGIAAHDTSRVIGILGQRGLDTFNLLDIGLVDTAQYHPFASLPMVIDTQYVDGGTRDITGRLSYVIAPVDMDVDSSGGGAKPVAGGRVVHKARVLLFPNPASQALSVKTYGLLPGTYHVEIFSTTGESVLSVGLEIQSQLESQQDIDLGPIPSGSYLVRVSSPSETVGTYSLIVVR